MLANGYGDPETGVVSVEECERFGAKLPTTWSSESVRQVVNCYRPPSWDMAFDIEVLTLGGVSAHDLRDERWYAKEAS